MTNGVMWLPLMLIALERARQRPFVTCLLGATGSYTMSVLTGYGQGFLYVGLLAGVYALFLVLRSGDAEQKPLRVRLASLVQWRPVFVAGTSIVLVMWLSGLSVLCAALPFLRRVRRS